MWHRVAGLVANTVISVPLPYTGAEGAESRADFLGKLQKRASTKESFPAPAAANGPSPTAQYGRTGSKKLVDIKQSRLAPFTTVRARNVC